MSPGRLAPLLALASALSAAAAPLTTRWAASLSPTNVLPEYPRPQLVRTQWQNLNGIWDWTISQDNRHPPNSFTNQILVPFPFESSLSGVEQHLDELSTLWYRRRFTLPESWRGQHVLLHFGAVDWSADVRVNGRLIGNHRGGYDAFSFDISDAVSWIDENELVIAVMDPTEGDQPRGKQSRKPEGIFYTASSGIWQTVWLEPLPPTRVDGVRLDTVVAPPALHATVTVNAPSQDLHVELIVRYSGEEVGRAAGKPGTELTAPLGLSRPWSPAQPSLYDVEIVLQNGGHVLDRVQSYFGLRSIQLGTDDFGVQKLFLNGKPLFQIGVLDQGFWPDGLYTAPSDEALRFDLETAKRLGFNLVRKHVKVEPERWYYWADRLGLLVWQDMPSANNTSEAGKRQFEMELQRLVEQKRNHPCICLWVLFNEGWGQFDTERLSRRLKLIDPTRLVDNASGWTDLKAGDVLDQHSYPEPRAPGAELTRARVVGEFGGLGCGVTNHTWSARAWGYKDVSDPDRLTRQYSSLLDKIWDLQLSNGLAAAIYTQLTDVETECNGFLTYDREVLKVDVPAVRCANLRQNALLVPDARQGSFTWSYTTNPPPADWMQPAFPASDWSTGIGGFGTRQGPSVIVNTHWDTSDIWLRRDFTLTAAYPLPAALHIYHDEDAEVYLNGVLAARLSGFIVNYIESPISPESTRAVHAGRNVMAIHCHQTGGGQYIDAGLAATPR